MDGKITIKRLQQYIKMKDFNPEKKHGYILKFMEESGELARAIHRDFPHAKDDNIKDTIEEEFCDVLYYLCAIANLYEVDIEKWIPVKERETDKRYGTDYFNNFFHSCEE
jgi:NTP pyrophosphatase (non-canonical NTP hydrolase)